MAGLLWTLKGHLTLLHVFEHFYVWDAHQFLVDAFSILAPGGQLVMEMPDITYVAKAFLGLIDGVDGNKNHGLWAMYGDPSESDPAYGHKWGWSPESLTNEMKSVGFNDVSVRTAQTHIAARDFRIIGVK